MIRKCNVKKAKTTYDKHPKQKIPLQRHRI